MTMQKPIGNYEMYIRERRDPYRSIAQLILRSAEKESQLNGTKKILISSKAVRKSLEGKGHYYDPRNPLVTLVIKDILGKILSIQYNKNLSGCGTNYHFEATDVEMQKLRDILGEQKEIEKT